jgi:hypothetical protein
MKYLKNKFLIALLTLGFAFMTSCEVEEVFDPNNPSVGSVTSDASKTQLQSLITGLESRHRGYFSNATSMFGSFGREVLPYFASDPRFIDDWLGLVSTETYPDFFGSFGTYGTPYIAVKQANVLIEAAQNSSALDAQEAAGYVGFAQTVLGHQMLYPWLQQWDNGIRTDVVDPLNPGPILSRQEALTNIRQFLENGANNLKAAGSELDFELTAGYSGFETPNGLLQINRAIAARAALYDEDWQGALNALSESFLNLNASTPADMNVGPQHVYGPSPDSPNPLFEPFDQPTNQILLPHPGVVEDALPGDMRIEMKIAQRVDNIVENGSLIDVNGDLILGEYHDIRWSGQDAPIPYIRNEELILIYAEANARLGNTQDAVDAINTIRTTWGLDAYDGATDTESLIEEILFQRRFSLWAEGGHRWVDLRRTDRLNPNYVDLRDGGTIFTQVARRTSETAWEER